MATKAQQHVKATVAAEIKRIAEAEEDAHFFVVAREVDGGEVFYTACTPDEDGKPSARFTTLYSSQVLSFIASGLVMYTAAFQKKTKKWRLGSRLEAHVRTVGDSSTKNNLDELPSPDQMVEAVEG